TLKRNIHSPPHSAAAQSQTVSAVLRCKPANPLSLSPSFQETNMAPPRADADPQPRTSAAPPPQTVRPHSAPLPSQPAFALNSDILRYPSGRLPPPRHPRDATAVPFPRRNNFLRWARFSRHFRTRLPRPQDRRSFLSHLRATGAQPHH